MIQLFSINNSDSHVAVCKMVEDLCPQFLPRSTCTPRRIVETTCANARETRDSTLASSQRGQPEVRISIELRVQLILEHEACVVQHHLRRDMLEQTH